MERVLVAGATGYLGRYVVKALKQKGYYVKVLVRSQDKLNQEGGFSSPSIYEFVDDIAIGDVTRSQSIKDVCLDVDFVFSSVGITNQKSNLTFMDVDFNGNLNLLREAERSKIRRFMYINVHGADECSSTLIKAKQRFVNELKHSSIHHIIINPTGYYSDMTELLTMARKGKVFLFGNGLNKMNPIHGADLANVCVSAFSKENSILEVGGPHVYTYHEMAELALKVVNKKEKITTIPEWLVKISLPLLRIINKKQYNLFLFFFYMMTHDVVAKSSGNVDLKSYYESVMKKGYNNV
ncbi:SDR family oxidoreductase [Gracilibacillus caseinilyticus]|uniref:SDR family oxidoreductase n=1 Tax=Gracilibacillus caseinilyticus TaxID=2932256 RepID=A0ABY4EZD8_9BACI|nr:SDR family oxidoreductase [Gracilibacillus caseinilyticus]UOQ49777.1 SDR family oxidoreductase [Gracilibacillus caseinilyticus]